MSKRAFLIVLDSYGVGQLPDAAAFGDEGANTLGSITASKEYNTPNMANLGLFNIDGISCAKAPVADPIGCYCKLAEKSMGKDTTIGHWEISGIISPKPMPTYPNGFPQDVIDEFKRLTGRDVLCNLPYSGTDALRDYGEEHLKTGALIVYTSADSVFQIAAHEELVPIEELYRYCQIARDMLTASVEHAVGRVIARPFLGTNKDDFKRTTNRHDYSIEPPAKTMLNFIEEAGLSTIGVGKIYDIFTGSGIQETHHIKGNHNGMEVTLGIQEKDFEGLCFVNLVDFDMVYGHRRDIDGYARAATDFDVQLGEFMSKMRPDDLLIITADHGCDPGYTKTTDHTREYIPMLAYGANCKQGVNLGIRASYSDIAATICEYLGVQADIKGESFLSEILK